MGEVIKKVSFPSDEDGYRLFQCPYCNNYFKLNNNELINEDIIDLFCPICGLCGELSNFITDEVVQHVRDIGINYLKETLNESLKKIERNSKGMFKVTKTLKTEPERQLYDFENGLDIMYFECCDKTAKILLVDKDTAYCPYCGVN